MKDEEVKIELNNFFEQYKNNSLEKEDIDKIEQYKKVIYNISEKKGIQLDHKLTDSPEKIDEIYEDFIFQISGSENLTDIKDLTKLIETLAPHASLVLAILTNHIDIASIILFHQLYMKKVSKI